LSAVAEVTSVGDRADFGPAVDPKTRALRYVSASAVTLFDAGSEGGCNRAWYFNKVLRMSRPERKSQALGKSLHAEVEHYLKTGEDVLGRLARQGKQFIPAPGADLLVEWPFVGEPRRSDDDPDPHARVVFAYDALRRTGRLDLDATRGALVSRRGVPWVGFIDLVQRRGYWLDDDGTQHAMPYSHVEVKDWKTTKDIERWAKRGPDLADTIQMTVYARWVVERCPEVAAVRVSHGYFATERHRGGGVLARKVTTLIDLDTIWKKWQRVEGLVEEMTDVAREVDVEKVPGNYESCAAYGGCPFASVCPRSPEQVLVDLLGPRASLVLGERLSGDVGGRDEVRRLPVYPGGVGGVMTNGANNGTGVDTSNGPVGPLVPGQRQLVRFKHGPMILRQRGGNAGVVVFVNGATGGMSFANIAPDGAIQQPSVTSAEQWFGDVWEDLSEQFQIQQAGNGYRVVPRVAPQVVPRVAPQVVPRVAPQVVPQVAPQVAPQVVPQVVPQVHTPQASTSQPAAAASTGASSSMPPVDALSTMYAPSGTPPGMPSIVPPDAPKSVLPEAALPVPPGTAVPQALAPIVAQHTADHAALAAANGDHKASPGGLDPVRVAEAVAAIDLSTGVGAGATVKDIAARLNVSETSARNALNGGVTAGRFVATKQRPLTVKIAVSAAPPGTVADPRQLALPGVSSAPHQPGATEGYMNLVRVPGGAVPDGSQVYPTRTTEGGEFAVLTSAMVAPGASLPTAPAVPPPAAPPLAAAPVVPFTLFLDVHAEYVGGIAVTDLEPYCAEIHAGLCRAARLDDLRLAPPTHDFGYNRWTGAVAAAARLHPPPPGLYRLRVGNDEIKRVIADALLPLAGKNVVRA
jgi:hypothetical protein